MADQRGTRPESGGRSAGSAPGASTGGSGHDQMERGPSARDGSGARGAVAPEQPTLDRYDPAAIEAKWAERWATQSPTTPRLPLPGRPKHYALTMFPYPSGDLHIGHWYAMVPADAHARYRRMCGMDVIFPMGFDAFGLPAENAAIKRGVHPYRWTLANIERMRGQLRSMGAAFDWDREIVTCRPEYYKWNQWLFLRFYDKGLAYKKYAPVDYCPTCNTTVAREQVIGPERLCERCDTPVTKKDLDQWFFRITAYADELLDTSGLDWPERVITMQKNWIGRSEGVQFAFAVDGRPDLRFEVFTTRIDTVFGVSFCVLAPEHPLVAEVTAPDRRAAVAKYQEEASRRSEIERLSTERERTGVFTGAHALHPLTGARIPIWIGDYVLASYGTGAIMAVPAHDDRDFDFARRQALPIPVVIAGPDFHPGDGPQAPYTGPGTMIHSGAYSGLTSDEGARRLADDMEARGLGKRQVNYRLRDWLISRQRYWGTPIPIVYCPDCGPVPVPDDQLPVRLPEDAQFLPTGESPLKFHEGFLRTKCPRCGGAAQRETDTMDTFVDSSWYQYRYLSPHDDDRPFDPVAADAWMPVDVYTGGVEHATMHLLYVRFFTKAMRDIGLTRLSEPMPRLFNQGVILGENSEKMSKSRGNVVNPDDLTARYGADTVRVYLMFIGPWEAGGPWNPHGIEGAVRFLQRVWRLGTSVSPEASRVAGGADPLRRHTHRTIAAVTDQFTKFGFNTAIAALMRLVNEVYACRERGGDPEAIAEAVRVLCLLLAPFAPHLAEECWARTGGAGSVHEQSWPQWDPDLVAEQTVEIAIQVDGKVKDRISLPAGATQDEYRAAALIAPKVVAALGGLPPARIVVVPGKLVNLVARR